MEAQALAAFFSKGRGWKMISETVVIKRPTDKRSLPTTRAVRPFSRAKAMRATILLPTGTNEALNALVASSADPIKRLSSNDFLTLRDRRAQAVY
jgi:hypothetical protein